MSHFSVLVVGLNPKEQLAPFQENNMGDCPQEYLKFKDRTEELKEESLEIIDEHENPEAIGKTRLEYYGKGNFDCFVKEWDGMDLDSLTGKYGYWENPNAKWDWYQEGGRYSDRLLLKSGKRANRGDIDPRSQLAVDLELMKSEKVAYANAQYDRLQKFLKNDPSAMELYIQFGIKPGEISKQLIAQWSSISTFAVVVDKKWYERGSMGWSAMVSDEKSINEWDEEFWGIVNGLDPKKHGMVSIIDCHI
jgi:hypothetical protein